MKQLIGFIGLGNMGQGMAIHLLKAGYKLIVFDIDRKQMQPLIKVGATDARTLTKVSAMAEIVILCLPHPRISKKIINQLQRKSMVKTIIDTSTLTPEDSIAMSKQLSLKKIEFLCAPILGGKDAANQKQIHFLVEGGKDTFKKYKNVFLSMGKHADYMGDIPNATLAKLAYNICRYSTIATAAEVSRFIRSYTKETKSIYDLLIEGSLDNFGQVWKEDMTDMVLSGKSYRPSHIPEKELSLIETIAKKKKLSGKLYKTIKEIYAAMG